jgi:serine/threonine protein phosphatase PrpC/tRNA A-37 threonylcarbamoyl transferase component Bud32
MASSNTYIGKYRVISELGHGMFGHVYKAQHSILTNRIVAIKLMRAIPLGSPQEREMFLQEARLLEALKHPHILPIIDVDFHEGFPYLVTEYAPNGSLLDRIKRQAGRPMAVEEVLTILMQVGQALQHAHQQNIIHRDLKPENILFNAKGEVLIADFGIAVMLASARTRLVGVGGTPAYMAPEQFEGMASTKSDQYALGCIAYELVTGHQPFIVPNPSIQAMWYQHAIAHPVAPGQMNPHLPIHIEQAILKAMAKQRTDRFADISTFVAALSKPISKQKHLRLDVAQLTDIGRMQPHNEDNIAYVIPKDLQVMALKGALFIVADGIEERAAGEVASEIAVDTVSIAYYQVDSEDIKASLTQIIQRANATIRQKAAEKLLRTDMGTTCVVAILRGNRAYIANVGNSRAYLIRGNQIKLMTLDHSWVAEQVRAGLLTEDQARRHPQRNFLTRSLGTQPEVRVDIFLEQLEEGDFLLLCTDGLYSVVNDEELLKIVSQFVPQESVYHLVERANENGGPDNITAIVVRILEVGTEPPGGQHPIWTSGR